MPALLAALAVKDRRATRLDLARWLVAATIRSSARVMVNRLWKLVFGQGLVDDARRLRLAGSLAHSPRAARLAGVRVRRERLGRQGDDQADGHVADLSPVVDRVRGRRGCAIPAIAGCARQSRFRLDAELVRDNALACAACSPPRSAARASSPINPRATGSSSISPSATYVADKGENQYRRGLYTYWQRTFLHPSLLAFDASTREECVVQRPRSNTPLQALVLLNDPTYVEAARAFAARLIREGGADPGLGLTGRFDWPCRARRGPQEVPVLLRPAAPGTTTNTRPDPAAARALLGTGDSPVPADIDPAELAAWTSVARVLLNLHETITRS